MSKRKKNQLQQDADPRLVNSNPTAISPEFIPKPTPDPAAAFTNRSDAVFDIIPELKGRKFK